MEDLGTPPTCSEGGGDTMNQPPAMVIDKEEGESVGMNMKLEKVKNKEPTANDIQSLQNKLMELIREDKPDAATKTDLTSKLEEGRVQSAKEKRLARKAAWIAESQKEIRQRKQFGETNLLEVFPELAWKRILEQLVENKDKIVMSNMDLLWRDLLKDERTTFLFNEVFPEVHDNVDLSRDEILICRSICKEWKDSLESHLQNEFATSASDNPSDNMERSFINNLEAPPAFLRESIASPASKNPFISRKLSFGLEFEIQPLLHSQLYWQTMQRILLYYGTGIWEVRITFDGNFLSINAFDRISPILASMPNLRSLKISGRNFVNLHESEILDSQELFKKNYYEPLQNRMILHPLPELPHLKTLRADMLPFPIIKEMLKKYGSSLEAIDIFGPHGNLNSYFGGIGFPHCKQLFSSSSEFTLAESRFFGNWDALEELHLKMSKVEGAITVPRIFQALSGFSATLRRLTLFIMVTEGPLVKLDENALKMLSLELPNLEKFTLDVYRINLKTIDFVLPMKSLKQLNITYRKQEKRKPKPEPGIKRDVLIDSAEIIKFGNYIERMYDSNIWNLLPELVKVTITVKKAKNVFGDMVNIREKAYTRDGYRQRDTYRDP